jgi:hypothetical protein
VRANFNPTLTRFADNSAAAPVFRSNCSRRPLRPQTGRSASFRSELSGVLLVANRAPLPVTGKPAAAPSLRAETKLNFRYTSLQGAVPKW